MIENPVAVFTCDEPGCGETELIEMKKEGDTWTDAHTEAELVLYGWRVENGRHFCPKHAYNPVVKGV